MLKIIIESEKTFAVEACSEIEAYTRGRSEILKELKKLPFSARATEVVFKNNDVVDEKYSKITLKSIIELLVPSKDKLISNKEIENIRREYFPTGTIKNFRRSFA